MAANELTPLVNPKPQYVKLTVEEFAALVERIQKLEENVQVAQRGLPHYNFPHPYHHNV